MTQGTVMFGGLPQAGLAQLVERWFCNPPSFPLKIHQSLGFLRFPRPLVCEISAPSERSAARKSAQSELSVSAPEENEDA
ncbi:hypothetical protein LCGC14_3090330 [marine sediment metagenome]|uniref:Uncharacterized protein n=1 Tax=marine sediment metagenome TaxID=412755 RepID=A0A0F8WZG1_9ZZZZ